MNVLLPAVRESLPLVEEFRCYSILFTSEGRLHRMIDRWISALMRSQFPPVVVKKELNRKEKLSICVPSLVCGPDPCVMTERAAKMCFLRKPGGPQSRAASPPRREESAEVAPQASLWDASLERCFRCVPLDGDLEEDSDTLEALCLSSHLRTPRGPAG